MGRPENWHFSFLTGPCRPCATASRFGTVMALDRLQVHTQAQADNGHCTDKIVTGVGADWPVQVGAFSG